MTSTQKIPQTYFWRCKKCRMEWMTDGHAFPCPRCDLSSSIEMTGSHPRVQPDPAEWDAAFGGDR